jgi:hypothetical protein
MVFDALEWIGLSSPYYSAHSCQPQVSGSYLPLLLAGHRSGVGLAGAENYAARLLSVSSRLFAGSDLEMIQK